MILVTISGVLTYKEEIITIKWFSGGSDRAQAAISIINNVLNDTPEDNALRKVLIAYKDELEKQESSVPYILSRMNIALSNVVTKNHIILSKSQADKLSELIKLSYISYGY